MRTALKISHILIRVLDLSVYLIAFIIIPFALFNLATKQYSAVEEIFVLISVFVLAICCEKIHDRRMFNERNQEDKHEPH